MSKEDFSRCSVDWDDDEDDDDSVCIGSSPQMNLDERKIHAKSRKRLQAWLNAKAQAAARGADSRIPFPEDD